MTKAELEAAARKYAITNTAPDWVENRMLQAFKAGALFGAEQAAKVAESIPTRPGELSALKATIATAIRNLLKDCERGGG